MVSSMEKRTKRKDISAGDGLTLTMVVPRLFRQKPLLMGPQLVEPLLMGPQLVDLARDTQRRYMRER